MGLISHSNAAACADSQALKFTQGVQLPQHPEVLASQSTVDDLTSHTMKLNESCLHACTLKQVKGKSAAEPLHDLSTEQGAGSTAQEATFRKQSNELGQLLGLQHRNKALLSSKMNHEIPAAGAILARLIPNPL